MTAPAPSIRRLGRDTLVYGLGAVLARAVSFLMLPVYTRYLRPEDYGTLQILQMVQDLTGIVLSAGAVQGVLRFYFKTHDPEERNRLITTALATLAGLNLIGGVLLALLARPIAVLALGGAGARDLVVIAAGNFILEAFLTVPSIFLQALGRAGAFVTASLVKLVLQLTLNVVFVVGFGLGVRGVLLSTFIASALVGGTLTFLTLRQTGLRVSAAAWRDLRRFGVPYQVATAGTFILAFGDRLFLEAYHGLEAVGLYGLAYQFGFLLVVSAAEPFQRAWRPQQLAMAEEPSNLRDQRFNEGFLYLNLLVITIALGLALFIRPMLAVMAASTYQPAAFFVPLILAAYVMQVWGDAVSVGIDVSEQTRYAAYATWISVVLIVGLYALLIPPFAGMGAAVATLVSFALRSFLRYRWSQRLWPTRWRWGRPFRLLGLATAITLISQLVSPAGLWAQLGLGLVLLLAYVTLVWELVLDKPEREVLRRLARAPRESVTLLMSA